MEALELACAQPIGRVRVAWNATLGLSFIIVICAIAAAAANDADPRGNKGAGFAGVWCIFVLFLVGINGSIVLLKTRSALMVGVLMGSAVMMSQLCFTLFAVFIGLARQAETTGTNDDDESAEGSDRALAAFFFMQFACYSAFCVALFMYRHDVIEDRADGALDRGMPPDVTSTPVAPSQERSTEPAAVGV